MLRWFGVLTAVAVLVAPLSVVSSAHADPTCPDGQTPVQTGSGVICVVVSDPPQPPDPGNPGTPGDGGGGGGSSGGSTLPAGCFKTDGEEVPCNTSLGTWWSGHQCYAAPYDAPPGSPAWQGHDDGSVWVCTSCTGIGNVGTCNVQILWLAPGQEPAPPDPAQLADTAIGLMPLAVAEVHTAPQTPARTFVGIENWLWVPSGQWATLSETVSSVQTSVTVVARPVAVDWDMGAGTITCPSAGEVWHVGMTDDAHTSCGYTYDSTSDSAPSGVYPIKATIQYDVSWTCNGVCTTTGGSLGLIAARTGAGSMRVLQRQTVVVR